MNTQLEKLVENYPDLKICLPEIEIAYHKLKETYYNNGKVLLCGNGGSASDCEHIVGELMKGFMLKRPTDDSLRLALTQNFPENGEYLSHNLQKALPAISLVSQTALISAFANDIAPDMVYAQQVYGYGQPGDILIGISTSGNSRNITNALQVAKTIGLHTIGLTGSSGGKMKDICDVTICVPWDETYKVQERHLPIYHTLCIMLEEEFFGQ